MRSPLRLACQDEETDSVSESRTCTGGVDISAASVTPR